MDNKTPVRVVCVETPSQTASQVLPTTAVIVVVVVLVITAAMLALGMTMQLVVMAVAVGGMLGEELVRSLVTVFSIHRAR